MCTTISTISYGFLISFSFSDMSLISLFKSFNPLLIHLKISKKVPVIFHNLLGYESHLIIKEISNFDVRVDVIPNRLEKYMAFTRNRNLVFIDSLQFMNSSLDSLEKNLVDKDFVYLSEKFSGKYLEVVKEKGIYPYEYLNSFKKYNETELPSKDKFFSSLKMKLLVKKTIKKLNIFGILFK